MELRDIFALVALHAMFAHPEHFLPDEILTYAHWAYQIADQMMAERERPTTSHHEQQPIHGGSSPTRPA